MIIIELSTSDTWFSLIVKAFKVKWRKIMPGLITEVNIKSDMPTADNAIKRITYHLRTSKSYGVKAIKIIHGYGSTGTGGKIRVEARRYLGEQKRKGFIHEFIPGEDFSIFNAATLDAFKACPDLRRDPDLERHNNGITIVLF
jgi:hypothetical protein